MRYEVTRDKVVNYEWRVEARDDAGRFYRVVFAGPDAEQRAREYQEWINSREAK